MKYLTLNFTSFSLMLLFIVKFLDDFSFLNFTRSAIASHRANSESKTKIVNVFILLWGLWPLPSGGRPALHKNRKWRNWWRITPARMYFNMKFKVVVGFARYILPCSGLYIIRALYILIWSWKRTRRESEKENEGSAFCCQHCRHFETLVWLFKMKTISDPWATKTILMRLVKFCGERHFM